MRKYIKFIILFLFAIFIFWFFIGRNLDWARSAKICKKRKPFIYCRWRFWSFVSAMFCGRIRWKVLLAPITETSLKELFATTTVGFAAVFFVGRAGEIVRPMWLPMRDKRVRPSARSGNSRGRTDFRSGLADLLFSPSIYFGLTHRRDAKSNLNTSNCRKSDARRNRSRIFRIDLYQRYSSQIIAWVEKLTDRRFIPRRIRRIFLSILKQLADSLWRFCEIGARLFRSYFGRSMLWLSIALPTWFVLLAFDLPLYVQRFSVYNGLCGNRFGRPDTGRRGGRFSRGDCGRFDLFECFADGRGGGFDRDASGLFRARRSFLGYTISSTAISALRVSKSAFERTRGRRDRTRYRRSGFKFKVQSSS